MRVLIGVDVGQRHQPSAVCAAEREQRSMDGRTDYHFLVRFLERLPAGSSFPAVADRVGAIVDSVKQRRGATVKLFVNATGLGQPIMEVMRSRVKDAAIASAYFNHGDRLDDDDRSEIKIGKALLVARLQMLLQTDRLHLPRTKETETLAKELLDFEVTVDPAANERYGAFKVGSRDDLVTALGLAVHDNGAARAGIMRHLK